MPNISYEGGGHKIDAGELSLQEMLVFFDNLDKFSTAFQPAARTELEAYSEYLESKIKIIQQYPDASRLLISGTPTRHSLPPASEELQHQQPQQQQLSLPPNSYFVPHPHPIQYPDQQTVHQSVQQTVHQPPYRAEPEQSYQPVQQQPPVQQQQLLRQLTAPPPPLINSHEESTVLQSVFAEVLAPESNLAVTKPQKQKSLNKNKLLRTYVYLSNLIEDIFDRFPFLYGISIGLLITVLIYSVASSSKSPIGNVFNSVKPSAEAPKSKPNLSPPVAPVAPVQPAPPTLAPPENAIPSEPPPLEGK